MDEKDALEISKRVTKNVLKAINQIPPEIRGKTVGLGKDGTPTKLIDEVAEKAALEVLKNEDVTIISEEAGIVGEGDIFVALDPLDGTFNATKGIPIYSISLCFSSSSKLGYAFFGYVYNLATHDEFYTFGEEAYWNDRIVRVSENREIRNCNAIVYYPRVSHPFKRMRVFGSAAFELCLVASGLFDCFIDIRPGNGGRGLLRIYDVAAGIYIIKRAGGLVTDINGEDLRNKRFTMDERLRIVASNKYLHKRILELIS